MKIVVVSDSHGHTGALQSALDAVPEALDVIFLGDGARDVDWLEDLYPERRFYIVRGNCDMGSYAPSEGFAPFGGLNVLYTHGHLYDVKMARYQLAAAAKKKGADLALYGHTHVAKTEVLDGVTLYNPGSVSTPGGGTYGVLSIENGVAEFVVHRL